MMARIRILAGVLVLGAVGIGAWLWLTAGHVSTDDAQVDAHVTQIAARISGTVTKVAVNDNQRVDAGDILVELDPRDYQVAVDKARS
jgi:membrane fusion protein (multidrug efflux system)